MHVPVITYASQLVGADKQVKILQDAIAQLMYLDADSASQLWFNNGLVFPLVRADETTGEPILYWKGIDYFKTIPEDEYKSMSFFYESDPRSTVGGGFSRYNFNLVVWYNQDMYARNLDYRIREFFINDIVNALHGLLSDENFDSITIFTEPVSVYSDFSVLLNNPKFKAPYDGFRISFELDAPIDCGRINQFPQI